MIGALVTYFLNSLWQVPLLALCTWLALRIAQPTPRTRYMLWIATALAAVMLPLRGIDFNPAASVIQATADYDGPLPALPSPRTHLPYFAIAVPRPVAAMLAALYLCLTAFALLRLLHAQLAVRRLLAASTPWQPALPGVRALPAGHSMPMVAGVLRPTILLPASLQRSSGEQLGMVLAHESAHIKRHDLLANSVLRAVMLPIAYHPATGYLHRQISRTRELLVDALAARQALSPGAYASALLALADHAIHPAPSLTTGLFEHPSRTLLEERIMHLIAPPTPSRRIVRMTAGIAVFAVTVATISLIRVTPAVLAAPQTTPQTPALVPAPAEPTAAQPLSPAERKRSAEQLHTAAGPSKSAAHFNLPEVQKQIAEVTSHNPIDPATQARLDQLSEEISRSAVNSPEFKRAMEDLHRKLDSPEFKRQLRELTEQAQKTALSAEAQRKMFQDVERQVNSPEFKRQIAQVQIDTAKLQKELAAADLPKQIAEATAAASLRSAPAAGAMDEPLRVASGVMAGQRESGKNPTYPPDAKTAHISGSVILHAIIGKDGSISSLQLISGPQELQQAAWDAVKTWVYKPYLLNGEPTEVETTITVTFSLGG